MHSLRDNLTGSIALCRIFCGAVDAAFYGGVLFGLCVFQNIKMAIAPFYKSLGDFLANNLCRVGAMSATGIFFCSDFLSQPNPSWLSGLKIPVTFVFKNQRNFTKTELNNVVFKWTNKTKIFPDKNFNFMQYFLKIIFMQTSIDN